MVYQNKENITTEELQSLIAELIDNAEPALVIGFDKLEDILIQHMDSLDGDSLYNILLLFAALNMRPSKKFFLLWQRALAKKLDKLSQKKIEDLALLLATMKLQPQRSFLRVLQQRLHARGMLSYLQQLRLLWAQTQLGMVGRSKAKGLFKDQESDLSASRKEALRKDREGFLSQEAVLRAALNIPYNKDLMREINSAIKDGAFSSGDKELLLRAHKLAPFMQTDIAKEITKEVQKVSTERVKNDSSKDITEQRLLAKITDLLLQNKTLEGMISKSSSENLLNGMFKNFMLDMTRDQKPKNLFGEKFIGQIFATVGGVLLTAVENMGSKLRSELASNSLSEPADVNKTHTSPRGDGDKYSRSSSGDDLKSSSTTTPSSDSLSDEGRMKSSSPVEEVSPTSNVQGSSMQKHFNSTGSDVSSVKRS